MGKRRAGGKPHFRMLDLKLIRHNIYITMTVIHFVTYNKKEDEKNKSKNPRADM